jgi:lipopolysaccharide transport system ATP-binding protein
MKPAIRVDNLCKQYHIGQRPRDGSRNLTENLAEGVRRLWRGLTGRKRQDPNGTFWALKDVSFEVQPGEVVGIIGRNGAGKSTLLKVLSRIVEPTSGRAECRGRMASLLEVGTGFHPELTGRENVYLNGSLLGMGRKEIERKFDEIVAFSEIEQFIDTPVKRYSSGMYVRLAFAVAANLEPEILIVDEVLAVGDAAFQKRCLGKIRQVGREGRTVLFVSHSMGAISSLCSSVMWVAQGQIQATGLPQELIARYLRSSDTEDLSGYRNLRNVPRQAGDQKVRFLDIRLTNVAGETTGQFCVGEPIDIRLTLESDITVSGEVGYTLKTMGGVDLFTSSSNDSGQMLDITPGIFELKARMNPNYLRPGQYLLQVGTTCLTCRDVISEAVLLDIVPDRHHSGGGLYNLPGCLHFPYTWEPIKGVTTHAG